MKERFSQRPDIAAGGPDKQMPGSGPFRPELADPRSRQEFEQRQNAASFQQGVAPQPFDPSQHPAAQGQQFAPTPQQPPLPPQQSEPLTPAPPQAALQPAQPAPQPAPPLPPAPPVQAPIQPQPIAAPQQPAPGLQQATGVAPQPQRRLRIRPDGQIEEEPAIPEQQVI
jgi:S-DNA-T family DNA segregation ATPase FtsK/SpoIIIE